MTSDLFGGVGRAEPKQVGMNSRCFFNQDDVSKAAVVKDENHLEAVPVVGEPFP